MKHSPGPWTADGGDIMCDANYCVAVAYTARTDDEGNWMPQAEVAANADLIAASPELLRELKFAVSVLQDNHIARGVAAALAAIRKAEGRGE